MPSDKPDYVTIGKLLVPFGYQGRLKVEILTAFPARFIKGARVFISSKEMVISFFNPYKNSAIIGFEEIDTLEQANDLREALIKIPAKELMDLPEDSYYHHDIIGLKVKTVGGEVLGIITQVLTTGGNDVYIAKGVDGELLIPAVKDVVLSIDKEKGDMLIEPIEGII